MTTADVRSLPPSLMSRTLRSVRCNGDLTKAEASRVSPTKDYHTREVSDSGSGKVDAVGSVSGAPQHSLWSCPVSPSVASVLRESHYCGARLRPAQAQLRLWLRVSQLTQIPDTDPGSGSGPDTRNTLVLAPSPRQLRVSCEA